MGPVSTQDFVIVWWGVVYSGQTVPGVGYLILNSSWCGIRPVCGLAGDRLGYGYIFCV